jgi:hypothetical protein
MAADEEAGDEDGSNTDEFEDEKEEDGGGDPMAVAEDAGSNAEGVGETRGAFAALPKPARLRGVAIEAAEFPAAAPRLNQAQVDTLQMLVVSRLILNDSQKMTK